MLCTTTVDAVRELDFGCSRGVGGILEEPVIVYCMVFMRLKVCLFQVYFHSLVI